MSPTPGRLLWPWTLDPIVLAVLVAAAAAYVCCLRRGRGARRGRVWRTSSFLTGLVVVGIALMSGIDRYAEQLLSVHMLQHVLLLLVAPALLLWGGPIQVLLRGSRGGGRRALARLLASRAVSVLTRPPVAFAAFAVVVGAWHLTVPFELALRRPAIHALEHACYLTAGLLLLAPLVGSDPFPRRPAAIGRFAWLTAAMVVMAIPGALLAFGPTVAYRRYEAPARALGHSALADQHLAGVVMWIGGGGLMLAIALGVAVKSMVREERRQRLREREAGAPTGALRLPVQSDAAEHAGTAGRRAVKA